MTPRPTQILALNFVLAAAFSASVLAQKVEIGNLAYEKNPPYPEAQNPQLPLEVYDDEFAAILGKEPKLIHLASGFGFTEGPVYLQVKNSDAGY
ncbi:MAG: hypothetical protein ACO3GO_08845, partial [Terrimicrobiaceae bacterium]